LTESIPRQIKFVLIYGANPSSWGITTFQSNANKHLHTVGEGGRCFRVRTAWIRSLSPGPGQR